MTKIEAGVPSESLKEQPKAAGAQEVADFASFRFEQASEKAGKIGSEAEREQSEKEAMELGETRLILAEAIAYAGDDATKVRDFLAARISELEQGLRKSSGDDRADYELHEKYDQNLRAQKFLYENKMRKFHEDKEFQHWKREQKPVSSLRSKKPEAEVEPSRNGRIFELRESLAGHEKEKLLNEVIEKSAKRIDIPYPKAVAQGERAQNQYKPYSYYSNSVIKESGSALTQDLAQLVEIKPQPSADIRSALKAHGVNELLSIEEVIDRPVYEKPKGTLGFIKSLMKPKISHYEPRKYREFFQGEGRQADLPEKDEPVIRFTYLVFGEPREDAEEAEELGESFVALELTLPRSAGSKLIGILEEDPKAIREIYRRSLHEKKFKASKGHQQNVDFSSGLYDPPYEMWDKKAGGRMYVQHGKAEQRWHPEFVRKLG